MTRKGQSMKGFQVCVCLHERGGEKMDEEEEGGGSGEGRRREGGKNRKDAA